MTSNSLHYPYPPAEPGGAVEIVPGLARVKLPLPFALDHVNVWLLGDSAVGVVDAGLRYPPVIEIWSTLTAALGQAGRKVTDLAVTHMHPDHVGMAGTLSAQWGAQVHMPVAEWLGAQVMANQDTPAHRRQVLEFYRAAGLDTQATSAIAERSRFIVPAMTPLPAQFHALANGTRVTLGGMAWTVITGRGHSPEHASLHCADRGILIAGDQILPRISPNLSTWPSQPRSDPVGEYLESLKAFDDLPDDTLVLPSHGEPFVGLHTRLASLRDHHRERLDEIMAACRQPASAAEIMRRVFRRELDEHQLVFALGETVAHLNNLVKRDLITYGNKDGFLVYAQS